MPQQAAYHAVDETAGVPVHALAYAATAALCAVTVYRQAPVLPSTSTATTTSMMGHQCL